MRIQVNNSTIDTTEHQVMNTDFGPESTYNGTDGLRHFDFDYTGINDTSTF